jgi:hypothetical protein
MGKNLMTQRSMVITKKEQRHSSSNEDSWLKTNIFQTRCTSKGKLCQVIVDSGCCENMVTKEMVDKLKLNCMKHNPILTELHGSKKGMNSPLIKDV